MSSASPLYASPCGWNRLLPRRETRALTRDGNCDVAIIGAGYSGVAAARRWAELRPDARILLLDALRLGEGNPGRNAGFLLEVSRVKVDGPAALPRANERNALLRNTVELLAAQAAASPQPCELPRCGTYRAAAGPAGQQALQGYRDFLDACDLPYESLGPDALAERLGTRFYQEAVYSPHCRLVQPAALIRALAAGLPDSVQLCDNTLVTDIERDGGRWTVSAAGHRIRADRVILANDAFAARLHRAADRLVAIYTSAGLTEPLDAAALSALGSEESWGLLPAHRLGATLRLTQDRRLLVRNLHSYEREMSSVHLTIRLAETLARRFPGVDLPPFASTWSGAIGYTRGGGPVWGQLDEGLWAAAGCNGGGVVKGSLFGRSLAELALGEKAPDIPSLFGRAKRLPPEPLRFLGYAFANGRDSWRARAELKGAG